MAHVAAIFFFVWLNLQVVASTPDICVVSEDSAPRCYEDTGESNTFLGCARLCSARQASLPCITAEADNGLLAGHVNESFFIGLYQEDTRRPRDGWGSWANGCGSTYRNWTPSEPSHWRVPGTSYIREHCAAVDISGGWHADPCSSRRRCVCERGASNAEDLAAHGHLRDTPAVEPGPYNYCLGPGRSRYADAKRFCLENGMALVSPRSAEENLLAQGACARRACWIGLERRRGEDWRWPDGERPGYSNWAGDRFDHPEVSQVPVFFAMYDFGYFTQAGRWHAYAFRLPHALCQGSSASCSGSFVPAELAAACAAQQCWEMESETVYWSAKRIGLIVSLLIIAALLCSCRFMRACRMRCVAVAIIPLTIFFLVHTVAATNGLPFTDECIEAAYLADTDVGYAVKRARACLLVSALLVEGPCAAWLLTLASTPYLKQVARYLVALWIAQMVTGLGQLEDCGMAVDATRSLNYTYFPLVCLVLCVRLALDRLASLEAHMLHDLRRRSLRRAFVLVVFAFTALIVLNAFNFTGTHSLRIPVFVLLTIFLTWTVALLSRFAAVHRVVRQASLATAGRRQQEAALASRRAAMEFAGLAASLATLLVRVALTTVVYVSNPDRILVLAVVMEYLDSWANTFGALALSGALSGALGGGVAHRRAEAERFKTLAAVRAAWQPCDHEGWQQKVVDLAHRALTLDALMDFYEALPSHMPGYDPARHRTADVVRRAIIPLSSKTQSALASDMMGGVPTKPDKMVTHNWGNLFRDLVAAILADALDEDEYEMLADLLDRDVGKIREWIRLRGVGGRKYWVCPFSVNQHAGICGSNPCGDRDPVTGDLHPVCPCGAAKFLNDTAPLHEGRSVGCEMNKFSDMMGYLSAHDEDFAQVIAVDAGFGLFSRAWCVSELAKAHAAGMRQHLKLPCIHALERHEAEMRGLRIQDMQASRPEDVEEILRTIPDPELFNRDLQGLIFGKLLLTWRNLDAQDQLAAVGRIARWQRLAAVHRPPELCAHRAADPDEDGVIPI